MATGQTIINSALSLIGVYDLGQTLDGTESNAALIELNDLVEEMSMDGLLQLNKVTENFAFVASTASYTIGSGATWNTARPIKIVSAFVRDSSNIDYNCKVLDYEEYLKTFSGKTETATIPAYIGYKKSYPYGIIYPYPVPSTTYNLYITSLKALTALALGDTINLPPAYNRLLKYRLAIALAPHFRKAIPQDVKDECERLQRAVENSNAVPIYGRCDPALLGASQVYNDLTRSYE